jgi:hypothetical protein
VEADELIFCCARCAHNLGKGNVWDRAS